MTHHKNIVWIAALRDSILVAIVVLKIAVARHWNRSISLAIRLAPWATGETKTLRTTCRQTTRWVAHVVVAPVVAIIA